MNPERKRRKMKRKGEPLVVKGEILRQILIRIKEKKSEYFKIAENRIEKAKLESPDVV